MSSPFKVAVVQSSSVVFEPKASKHFDGAIDVLPGGLRGVQGNDPETVIVRGGSAIISPLSQVLAGPVFNEDAILVTEIDPADISRGKYDFDVVGHYAGRTSSDLM